MQSTERKIRLHKFGNFFVRKNFPSIFGSSGFIDKIRNRFGFLRQDQEISGVVILSVDAKDMIMAVCDICNVSGTKLLSSRRGITNIPRDPTIYTLRLYSQKTLFEIGKAFGADN